jgi:hypothetical protein
MFVSSTATALPVALQGSKFSIANIPGVAKPSFWSQLTSGVSKVFTTANIDKAVAIGAAFTQLKYGGATNKPGESPPGQATVGATNPPPGDWLSRIYENPGQPNQSLLQSIDSNKVMMIGGAILLVLFVLMARR